MRKRWLFILLCAILIQLASCEHTVDDNGYSSETILSDPSANPVFYGEKTANGSEFMSAREKIRRVRSTAENATSDKPADAKQAREQAEGELKQATEELDKAEAELAQAEAALADAQTKLAAAETNKKTAEGEKTRKSAELTAAEGNYATEVTAWEALKSATAAAEKNYTDLKNKTFAEGTPAKIAKDAADKATGDWNAAKTKLEEQKGDLSKATAAMEEAKPKSEAKNKTIEDYNKYRPLKDEIEQAKLNVSKTEETLKQLKNDTTPEDKRKSLENILKIDLNSTLVNGFVRRAKVTEALKKLEENLVGANGRADKAQVDYLNKEISYYKELAKHYGGKIVEELKEKYNDNKNKVDQEIKVRDEKVKNLTDSLPGLGEKVKAAEAQMKNETAKLNINAETIENEYGIANASNITAVYKKAIETEASCAKQVAETTANIELLKTASDKANAELDKATGTDEVARLLGIFTTAKQTAEDHHRDKVEPANNAVEKLKKDIENCQNDINEANNFHIPLLKAAVVNCTNWKSEAEKVVATKRAEKETAEAAVPAALRREKEEREREATVQALTAGFGATALIVVLVAIGVLAFFCIRQRRKRKAEEEKPKPPPKVKFRDECGLMRVQKPGEKDKLQVDGDDIKVRDRGTTFPRWHNYDHETMNWKHTFDGPEGEGIKSVRKIFFDMNQVEAIPTGPAHDFIEGGDSVTRSEVSRKQPARFLAEETAREQNDEEEKKEKKKNPSSSPAPSSAPPSSEDKRSDEKIPTSKQENIPNKPPASSPSGPKKKSE